MTDGIAIIIFSVTALAVVALMGLHLLVVVLSGPPEIPANLPPERRLEFAKLRLEAAQQWMSRAASPSSVGLARREWRNALRAVEDAKRELRRD